LTITPINASAVTQAIEAMLTGDPTLNTLSNLQVERSEPLNDQPSRCPWLGIYRTGVQLPSHTLGMGSGYRLQQVGFAIFAQQSHPESGSKCEELLEALVQQTLSVLLSDETLQGNVDVLDQVAVTYLDYSQVQNAFMQTAIIQAIGITRVSGG